MLFFKHYTAGEQQENKNRNTPAELEQASRRPNQNRQQKHRTARPPPFTGVDAAP